MKRPQRPKGEPQQGAVSPLSGTGGLDVNERGIAVIRAGKTRHGPRGHWRQSEFAQLAIQSLYGALPPRHLNRNQLMRDVNEWLQNECIDYKSSGLGKKMSGEIREIPYRTIVRALRKVFP